MTLIRLLIPMLVFPLAVLAQTASSKGRYIVIVGMLSEKKIADGSNVVVITGAMKEASLRETLAKLDSTGAKGVISFGVAGGLNPDLKVGQLIIPQTIVFGKKRWDTSESLSNDLRVRASRAGVRAVTGTIATSEEMNEGKTEQRLQLRSESGGDAVDMESHIAAAFAQSRGLPFAAVRVLSDAVGDEFPPAALLPLDEKGDVKVGAVFGSILINPWQVGALMRVGKNFRASTDVLSQVRKNLDPLFGTAPVKAEAPVRVENSN